MVNGILALGALVSAAASLMAAWLGWQNRKILEDIAPKAKAALEAEEAMADGIWNLMGYGVETKEEKR